MARGKNPIPPNGFSIANETKKTAQNEQIHFVGEACFNQLKSPAQSTLPRIADGARDKQSVFAAISKPAGTPPRPVKASPA